MDTSHAQRTAEMIAVMQAYIDGKRIEWRRWPHHTPPAWSNQWQHTILPVWDWSNAEYRIESCDNMEGT